MQAVILAGGRGIRLAPLTDTIPKPMVQVKGKPFLEHLIRHLKSFGVRDFVLCVGYLSERIVEHFGDGSRLKVSIKYSVEKEFLGTGGALKNAEGLLEQEFILLNGDTFLDVDYRKLISAYRSRNAPAMMVVYGSGRQEGENNTLVDEDWFVAGYDKEHPEGMNHVDAGVIFLNKDLVGLIPPGRPVSLESEVYPKLIQGRMMKAYATSQRFYDIGTPEKLRRIGEVL